MSHPGIQQHPQPRPVLVSGGPPVMVNQGGILHPNQLKVHPHPMTMQNPVVGAGGIRQKMPGNGVGAEEVVLTNKKKKGLISKLSKFMVDKLDGYGASIDGDPGFKKKTWAGAIFSIVFKIVFLYNLAKAEVLVEEGNLVTFNPRPSKKEFADFPHLQLEVDNSLMFFEPRAPSIQRIEVLDRSQLPGVPCFSSNSDEKHDPKTTALYTEIEVPLNSFNEEISLQTPQQWGSPGTINLQELINEQKTHSYLSETMRGIKSLQGGYDDYEYFFNHTVTTFVRFKKDQLRNLKTCQLQVVLANAGEYGKLIWSGEYGKSYTRALQNRLTLTSINSLWKHVGFEDEETGEFMGFDDRTGQYMGYDFKTYIIKRHYTVNDIEKFAERSSDLFTLTDDEVASGDLTNWILQINYANNFRAMNEYKDQMCADFPDWWRLDVHRGYKNMSTDTMWMVPTTETDNTLCWAASEGDTNVLPFWITVANYRGKEIIKVTGMSGTCETGLVFTITRGTPQINFALAKPTQFPHFPTSNWKCNPADYNQGICLCNCGMFDPGCFETGFWSESCGDDELCSMTGRCISHAAAMLTEDSQVVVSEICTRGVFDAGQQFYVGFLGGTAGDLSECELCPMESIYNFQPKKSEEHEGYVCNYHTKGTLDPLTIDPQSTFVGDNLKFNVSIFRGASFPVMKSDEFSETVKIMVEDKVSYLVESWPKTPDGTQQLQVQGDEGLETLLSKISLGWLRSSISSKSKNFMVKVPTLFVDDLEMDYSFVFPEKNFPYYITLDEGEVISVVGFTTEYVPELHSMVQFGTLESYPDFDYGMHLETKVDMTKDITSFDIEFSSSTDTIGDIEDPPFQMIIQDDDADFIEVVRVLDIEQLHTWDCDLNEYFARDGVCNCGCGMYDPDCAMPSPKEFADMEGFVDGCDDGEFCSFPGGVCTSTKPTSSERITRDKLEYRFTVENPLKFQHDAGTILHYIPDLSGEQLQFSEDGVVMRRVIPVTLYRSASETEFPPSQRYKAQSNENFESPGKLNVEVAMFVAPDRPTFENLNLCPKFTMTNPYPVKEIFGLWELRDAMKMSVECEERTYKDFSGSCTSNVNSLEDFELGKVCAVEMPPTKELEFKVAVPITHRFKELKDEFGNEEKEDYVFDAETLFDFEMVYHFHYDQAVEEIERKFARNKIKEGDMCVVRENDSTEHFDHNRRFFGALEYRGPGNGTSDEGDLGYILGRNFPDTIPASSPYLFTKFSLNLRSDAIDRVSEDWEMWYKKEKIDELNLVFESFDDIVVVWDFGDVNVEGNDDENRIPLRPGDEYTLTAKLQMIPFYRQDMWSLISNVPPFSFGIYGMYDNYIESYRISVMSTSVKITSDPSSKTASVRYVIEFDGKVRQFKEKREYVVSNLLSDLGSALALTGMGLAVLKIWQSIFQKDVKYLDLKKKQIKERFKKEQKKIQKEMKKLGNRITGSEGVTRIEVGAPVLNQREVEFPSAK